MKAKTLFIAFFIGFSVLLFGQQSTLRGVVTDKSGETIIGGDITIYKDKVKKLNAVTDIEGKYSVNLDAGTYDVEFNYLGLKTLMMKKVLLPSGQIIPLNAILEENQSQTGFNCGYLGHHINDVQTAGFKLDKKEISRLPTRDIGTMINMNQSIVRVY
jgi:hypothetical protein